MSREKSRVRGGDGKGVAIVRGDGTKGEPSPPTPIPVVDSLTANFSVSFISDEPDYNQSGSISPQKATPGGQSHYSGKVVSVKQTAC